MVRNYPLLQFLSSERNYEIVPVRVVLTVLWFLRWYIILARFQLHRDVSRSRDAFPSRVSNVVALWLPVRSVFIMLDVVYVALRRTVSSSSSCLSTLLHCSDWENEAGGGGRRGSSGAGPPVCYYWSCPYYCRTASIAFHTPTTTPISCLIHFTDHSLAYQSRPHTQLQPHHHYIPSMDMYCCYCIWTCL